MELDTDYESLLAGTKLRLNINLRKEPQNASLVNVLLKDCCSCVNKSLYLVTESLSVSGVYQEKLTKFLSDAVDLLQMLTGFIKMVMKVLSMNCCEMETYPTVTGTIILSVFTHCKDSQSLYGSNIISVQKELRNLFISCHELQLIYLLVLERHFVFDLANKEEKDILMETLDINLKICEIVQLDAKPMAIQWKSYTSMCEKYCNILMDMNIFENSVQVICGIIKRNVETIFKNEDIIMMTRSLKVVNFFFKILQKECDIFKHASWKNYDDLVNLLFCIYQSQCVCLDLPIETAEFVNQLVIPSERLFKQLLLDEAFANSVINYDLDKVKQGDLVVGYVLLIASIMECLTTGRGGKSFITKPMVVECLYKILPLSSYYWDTDIVISREQKQMHGLFDHLLIHAAALAITFTSEEYSLLERHMAEAILGTECASALFSANLWHVLSMVRNTNPQLLFNQVVWLCTMYKKIEKHKMFHLSPQKIHLSHTISRLFYILEDDDKLKICKQVRIHDDDNISLWTALGVRNLPSEAKTSAQEVITEKLKAQFQCAMTSKNAEDVKKLTKLMSLAATCDFAKPATIEHFVTDAWSKTCFKNQLVQDISAGTVWFYEYLKALVQITDSLWQILRCYNGHLVKILSGLAGIIEQCSVEYKLLLIDMLCKIATSFINRTKDVDENFTQAFTCLSQDSEEVRNQLFITLKQYRHNSNMDKVIPCFDSNLREIWTKITDGQDLYDTKGKIKGDTRFTHKCFKSVESKMTRVISMIEQSSGSFDFADNADLFENNSVIEEPECKKVKLENAEAEVIVKRLESDADSLCTMKEIISIAEFKSRIANVCDKLKNIIH